MTLRLRVVANPDLALPVPFGSRNRKPNNFLFASVYPTCIFCLLDTHIVVVKTKNNFGELPRIGSGPTTMTPSVG